MGDEHSGLFARVKTALQRRLGRWLFGDIVEGYPDEQKVEAARERSAAIDDWSEVVDRDR